MMKRRYYSITYEESRQQFIDSLKFVRQYYPQTDLYTHTLTTDPNLHIDWIIAQPPKKERLFILTSGEHGIEGYTGAAMQQLFLHEYLTKIDHHTAGVVLVHAINPYGMKYHRKVNGQNVDLNRNFAEEPEGFDPAFNPAARRMESLVYPRCAVNAGLVKRNWFLLRVLWAALILGRRVFMAGSLMGQYCYPDGIYYGSTGQVEETQVLLALYRGLFADYPQVLHLDMHTGYGPRYQMSLVNSPRQPASSLELSARYHYPLVQKADPEEFYSLHGDMVDYLYQVAAEFPHLQKFYSAACEFGTYGDSLAAGIRSLRTMVFEMQARRFGTSTHGSLAWVEEQFNELYYPAEIEWREKAANDMRMAFDGILTAEGFLRDYED